MRTIDKIQEILNTKNISAAKMMRELGFSSGLFSQWKTGKQKPSLEKLEMIADYLDVTIETLRKDELKEKAIEKFGFCWESIEAENIKNRSREKISSGELNDEEMFEESINILKSLFSRSLEAYSFSPKHVDFETFSAMILNQGERQRSLFGDLSDKEYEKLYKKLIDKFGKKNGIPKGSYYPYERYHDTQNDVTLTEASEKTNIIKDDIHNESSITPHEKKVITAYRNHPEMQPAVDTLLGVEKDKSELIEVRIAARSKDGKVRPHTEYITREQYEAEQALLEDADEDL